MHCHGLLQQALSVILFKVGVCVCVCVKERTSVWKVRPF